jgi:lactobin A/cerein 7B family class IIb bacteriocin
MRASTRRTLRTLDATELAQVDGGSSRAIGIGVSAGIVIGSFMAPFVSSYTSNKSPMTIETYQQVYVLPYQR